LSGWYSLVNLPYAKSSSLHEVGFKSRILNTFLVLGLKVVRERVAETVVVGVRNEDWFGEGVQ